MSYNYNDFRNDVFKEENQQMFLSIKDKALELINIAGCARMQEIIRGQTGDSWVMLACVDRLVEMGFLKEVGYDHLAGQYRIFTK